MKNELQKYVITLLVDNREWNSLPIEGDLGDLQNIIDQAFEQHRISRSVSYTHLTLPTILLV